MPIQQGLWNFYKKVQGNLEATQKMFGGLTPKQQAVLDRITPKLEQQQYADAVINIPGWDDIVAITERNEGSILDVGIQQWFQNEMKWNVDPLSPTPEVIQHFGHFATIYDDFQDFAAFLRMVGLPIITPVLQRILRPWGWMNTERKFAEHMFRRFCLLPRGKQGKRDSEKADRGLNGRRRAKLKSSALLALAKSPFTKILLAGQVLHEFTGYGLQLGAIMGMAIDTPFGIFKALQGKRVVLQAPLPSDPIYAAGRMLLEVAMFAPFLPMLTPAGMALVGAVWAGAHQIIGTDLTNTPKAERIPEILQFPLPQFDIWNPITRWIDDTFFAPLRPEGGPPPPLFTTFEDTMERFMLLNHLKFQDPLNQAMENVEGTTYGDWSYQALLETTREHFKHWTQPEEELEEEIDCLSLANTAMIKFAPDLPPDVPITAYIDVLQALRTLCEEKGEKVLTVFVVKEITKQYWEIPDD